MLAALKSETKSWAPYLVAVASCAAIAWLASTTPFDLRLSEGMRSALGEHLAPAAGDQPLSSGFAALGYLLCAVVQTELSRRLPNPDRILATICVFSASVLYQWLGWQLLSATPHPLGFLSALGSAFACGSYWRLAESASSQDLSHHLELKLKEKEILETRLDLVKQDEIERRTLAADLHDQVLNDLKQLAQRFDEYSIDREPSTADYIRQMLKQVMSEIREVMDTLSPSVLEHLGLPAALEDCLRRGSQRAGFKVRFKNSAAEEQLATLSLVENGLLYRLAQESITNICKHAGASLVRLSVASEDDRLVIKIIDDGSGIDPHKLSQESRGLKYMRYRAALIGARISWEAGEEGKGTCVRIELEPEKGN